MQERPEKDEAREERIIMEVVVDAYDEEERAMGWFYYLDDKMRFPFEAKCVVERRISPLKIGERVQVKGMTVEDDCMQEMFVEIELFDRTFGVPLAQLQPIDVDADTQEAIDDWKYWVDRGYCF
jgi:hypothetical protein